MCIFLIKPNNEAKQKIIEKKVNSLISEIIPKMMNNIKKKKQSFEFYSTFQFVWIDFQTHNKFVKNLRLVQEKNDDLVVEDLKAFGLIANNKKISCLNEMVNFDDWLFDLLESPENQHFIYISEAFNEDLTHYLKNENDTLLSVDNYIFIIFYNKIF